LRNGCATAGITLAPYA